MRFITTTFLLAAAAGAQQPTVKEPILADTVYLVEPETGALLPTEKAVAKTSMTIGASSARVPGTHADFRVEAGRPVRFALKLKPGKKPGSYALFQFGIEGDQRVVSFKRSGLRGMTWLQGRQIVFDAAEENGFFLLTPSEALGAGEYGFSPAHSNDVYLFGIDPRTPPVVSAPATATITNVDQRMRSLQDLLDKGLISKQDYDRKRAELQPVEQRATSNLEDRLKKLDGLFKNGLLTKEEYDKKRADLLAEL
jgi:uncharacterized protein YqgQ